MAIVVTHTKVSTIPDGDDSSLIRPSDWNQTHTLVGLGTAAELNAGVANGVATLDGTGKVPVSELPAAVLGALSYQGTWNASTNTPTLTSSVGTKGYYYVVNVAGSTDLNGITDWQVGDWAVYNGTVWQKVDNTDAGGDVVGPASATDNAITRFDGTTGRVIQNSVVTIGDTGAATGFTTLSASTSLTTPIVQASNSGGLALKNSGGTTQMSVGAGGGDNMSINVSTNLNGTNAQIDISPTGTGHVHIKPTGVNSVEIAPTFVGEMDNITIGAITPAAGSFTDLSVTGTTSFDGSQGTAGQVLTSAGTGATPTWATPTTGTVTSVGLSAPAMFTVGGSPVTSSGTLALTYSGTALPLANGGTGATSGVGAMANLIGFTSTATAGGTTTLTNASTYYQLFTGTLAQTVVLPVTSTLQQGWSFHIVNNSTVALALQSSGLNSVISVLAGTTVMVTCILTTGTTAASWEAGYTDFSTATGTGNVVLATSPTITGAMNFAGGFTQNSNFGSSNQSGTLSIGGTAQTGLLTIGPSTLGHTANIESGATASGSTKIITFGTGGLTGSTTTMTIGSTFGTSVTANGSWYFSSGISGGTF